MCVCVCVWERERERDFAGHRPATSSVHYTTRCNTQSSAPEDGQNNCPKHVELTGIINKPLLLHLVGCLYYLYQLCTVKQISDNEIYLLIKYIKSVLWRVAKRLSYIEDARCLKVKHPKSWNPFFRVTSRNNYKSAAARNIPTQQSHKSLRHELQSFANNFGSAFRQQSAGWRPEVT